MIVKSIVWNADDPNDNSVVEAEVKDDASTTEIELALALEALRSLRTCLGKVAEYDNTKEDHYFAKS